MEKSYKKNFLSQWIFLNTALLLSMFFGNSAKFWLGLQDDFDIENAQNLHPSAYKQIKITSYLTA